MPPWFPACLAYLARTDSLSGTVTMVPSIAHTNSPRHQVPR